MYGNINELPSEVRNSLDEEDCQVFLEKFNEKNPQTKEEYRDAMSYAWNACRQLPSSFSFDIIASVEDVDSDGELISIDSLKNQMDKFIEQGGTVQSEHGNYHVATIWDWEDYTDPDTGYPGVIVHGNVFGGRGENAEYTQARQDFIEGKNNLSIAGDASVEGYECDGARCFVRRNLSTLMEISLVSNPANPYATLQWYNDKAVVKSGQSMKVQNVGIHKSYNECDLEAIRKALRGYDCEVSRGGVHVHTNDLGNVTRLIKGIGQVTAITGVNSIWVDSNKRILEREFRKSYSSGECNNMGVLQPTVDKGRFTELFSRNIIRKNSDGSWAFNGDILRQ